MILTKKNFKTRLNIFYQNSLKYLTRTGIHKSYQPSFCSVLVIYTAKGNEKILFFRYFLINEPLIKIKLVIDKYLLTKN
jgi:hypothetical protein